MTVSRPGNKTPGVKFSVESDVQVKNKHVLRLGGKNKEKRNSKNSKKLFFMVFGHSSESSGWILTKIGGNDSYKHPGAF